MGYAEEVLVVDLKKKLSSGIKLDDVAATLVEEKVFLDVDVNIVSTSSSSLSDKPRDDI